MEFSLLLGKTLVSIVGAEKDSDIIQFLTKEGESFAMYHNQDCCESVAVEDIEGDIQDLLNSPITQAEESTNDKDTFGKIEYSESFTWTFYKLATIKGYVTIRWLGQSNGYYSESVDFVRR
jgi:hypothetical protein